MFSYFSSSDSHFTCKIVKYYLRAYRDREREQKGCGFFLSACCSSLMDIEIHNSPFSHSLLQSSLDTPHRQADRQTDRAEMLGSETLQTLFDLTYFDSINVYLTKFNSRSRFEIVIRLKLNQTTG